MSGGTDDITVCTASAKVAADRLDDLLVAGRWSRIEQRFHAHDLPGGAEAALEGIGFDEGALDPIELAVVRKSFDCGDVAILAVDREQKAAILCFTIDDDGARAAVAHPARLFAARQLEVMPQRIDQCPARLQLQDVLGTVDPQRHALGLHGALD